MFRQSGKVGDDHKYQTNQGDAMPLKAHSGAYSPPYSHNYSSTHASLSGV